MNLKDKFLLDKEVVFLNHGSFGACPAVVMESYQHWQRELEKEPVRFMSVYWVSLLDTAREKLAAFLHATPENLAFVENSTFGVNVVAHSLGLGPGHEVLSTQMEYGACERTWQYYSRQKGFAYRKLDLPLQFSSKNEILERFEKAIRPETKVIFVSHIVSATGVILPVKEIVEMAATKNIITVIDGAHAPGQIDLDLDALHPDFYFGNCHKWMLSAKGAAFLYVKPEFQSMVRSPVVSWGKDWEQPNPSDFISEVEVQGTRDLSAFLSVPAAIEFMEKHRWNEVRAEAKRHIVRMQAALQELWGTEPITSDLSFFGQMYAHPLPHGIQPEVLRYYLWHRHKIEIPVTTLGLMNYLRISFQAYNKSEDYDRLLEALQAYASSI